MVKKITIPSELSTEVRQREVNKEIIERIGRDLRRKRKAFVLKNNKSPKAVKETELNDAEFRTLQDLVQDDNYQTFPIQICDVLVEGIKYPDQKVQLHCGVLFVKTQQKGINSYLWKKILSANFIPEIAQQFIATNRERLAEQPSIAYLLEGCEQKFSGKEREASDFFDKEKKKANIDNLAQFIRQARKNFRTEQNCNFAFLPEHAIKMAQEFLNMNTYLDFPIQVADLVYEGCKSTDSRIEKPSLNFVEEMLKMDKLDIYFWTKMLKSDWVPDTIWPLFITYSHVFMKQKEDFKELIDSQLDTKRSENSTPIYNEIVDMYVTK